MNDEIKEILDRLDYNEWEVDLYKVPITWCELYDIRDYITNLQQENERLFKEKLDIQKDLTNRIYKARKMIFDNYGVLDKYEIELLDDILQGSENDDR